MTVYLPQVLTFSVWHLSLFPRTKIPDAVFGWKGFSEEEEEMVVKGHKRTFGTLPVSYNGKTAVPSWLYPAFAFVPV